MTKISFEKPVTCARGFELVVRQNLKGEDGNGGRARPAIARPDCLGRHQTAMQIAPRDHLFH